SFHRNPAFFDFIQKVAILIHLEHPCVTPTLSTHPWSKSSEVSAPSYSRVHLSEP
ncbi:hypothetical protein NPIL_672341, partial [Nephila pilipes]